MRLSKIAACVLLTLALAQTAPAIGQESSGQELQGQESQEQESQGQESQEQESKGQENADSLTWWSPLVIVQIVWMILVTIGAVCYSRSIGCIKSGEVINQGELRGLNLPRGSIRGILALATIGSFVNVMVLGAPVLGDSFESVLAAFGTLTGSIIGFYFGTRGATPLPSKEPTGSSSDT